MKKKNDKNCGERKGIQIFFLINHYPIVDVSYKTKKNHKKLNSEGDSQAKEMVKQSEILFWITLTMIYDNYEFKFHSSNDLKEIGHYD